MRTLTPLAVAATALITGCTVAPDVSMTYVMPKARTLVTVTQTIACTTGHHILSVASATIATSYVPDYDSPQRGTVSFQAPDSALVDTDTAVSLTDDGRLSSINATYTGEGAAVVKSLIALAGAFPGGAPAAAVAHPETHAANPTFCGELATYAAPKPASPAGGATANPTPTLTLTYTNQFDFQITAGAVTVIDQSGTVSAISGPTVLEIPPDANSSPIVTLLTKVLPAGGSLDFNITVSTGANPPQQPSPAKTPDSSDRNIVTVPKLVVANFQLTGPVGDLSRTVKTAAAQALVPSRDTVAIPLGKSQPFGKIATTLTVAGSGLVNKLEYNKGSGAADLVTAASEVATAAQPPAPQTSTQLAANLQGQADEIYQQQRLLACKANPSQCTAK